MPKQKIALLTGCSSGIGRELLGLLDTGEYRVVGTALPASIDSIRGEPIASSENIRFRELDVMDFQQSTRLVEETQSDWGPIDILINNAGISYRSTVEDMSPADEQRQIQTNYLGAMHLIRECLPAMRKQRSGRIVNVSSVGGMMAMPTMASYSASKFALEGATESLWYELKPWNIHVSLVRPGFINSLAFTKVQHSEKKRNGQSSTEYDAHYENMTGFVEFIMRRTPCKSENVAKRIFKLIRERRPPLRVAGTPDATLFFWVRRLLPRFFYHKLLYLSLPKVKTWGPSKSDAP